MIKTAFLVALTVTALASMPAHAQQRVFVSGLGVDTNPCSVTQPCRTFQHAHDTFPANSEIEVVDPAGYGPLTITHGISIQGHGFGGIFAAAGDAITVSVATSDPVTLNGLLIDGRGTGVTGFKLTSGPSVQILNSVVRHFNVGINDHRSTTGSNLLIEDTIASDNGLVGITTGANPHATLNRITADNNASTGVSVNGHATISNSVISNNFVGLQNGGVTWLAKNVISGNGTGVVAGPTVNSYGDNYIRDNTTPVAGVLTPVTTQ
jgi:Right handed beta helix region